MALHGRDADEVDFPFLDSTMPAIGAGNVGDEWVFEPYPRLVKTHARWLPFFQGNRSIGLVRDPRDVMVSYYHYQKDRNQIYDGSFSDFVRDHRFGLRRWIDHHDSWRDRWNLVIRYEDMKANTIGQLERILRFLGIETKPDQIERAVKRSAMERTRRVESTASENENAQFARRGKTKQWTKYFSKDDEAFYQRLMSGSV
jgi:hypothetical protein